jgi:DNA-binding beta-propeller fold protein YncE
MKRLLVVAIHSCVVLVVCGNAQSAPISQPHYIVSDYVGHQILRFDAATGTYLDTLAQIENAAEMAIGPDGFLYVSDFVGQRIRRVNQSTGESEVFVADPTLSPPRGIIFGPNGNLLAQGGEQINEYDAHTGAFVRTFTSGPPIESPIAHRFAPDGSFFVARGYSSFEHTVMKYDATGHFLDQFGGGLVHTPQNLVFGPDGALYVANQLSEHDIVRFNWQTGQYLNTLVADPTLSNPQGLHFRGDGVLLVASGDERVRKFDAMTGIYLGDFINDPRLQFAVGIIFVPEPTCLTLLVATTSLLFLRRRTRN